MDDSRNSPQFFGVADLRRTSMGSGRDHLTRRRRVRKDSPIRKSSGLSVSFMRECNDAKDDKRMKGMVKVRGVPLRHSLPEVFTIPSLLPADENKVKTREQSEEMGEGDKQGREKTNKLRTSSDSLQPATETEVSGTAVGDKKHVRGEVPDQDKEEQQASLAEDSSGSSSSGTPVWHTPWFADELAKLRKESRLRWRGRSQSEETKSTSSLDTEAAASTFGADDKAESEELTVCMKKSQPHQRRTSHSRDLNTIQSESDPHEPLFVKTVWTSLRTDVMKAFTDFGSRLLRPPSSDVMHMRPLIRAAQGKNKHIHFIKSDQESSEATKLTAVPKPSTVAPLETENFVQSQKKPCRQELQRALSQHKVITSDDVPTEGGSNTTKSVSRHQRASAFSPIAGSEEGPTSLAPGTQGLPTTSPGLNRRLLGELRPITRTWRGQN